jgi:hypothetical protein
MLNTMTKAGDSYRELVGTVAAALDPGSIVKTEQWIDGPDGERDMDVEIRGSQSGQSHFILIECKDHAKRIGIGYVDAFESKIRDLKPDRAILFSNSGFTRGALRKAKRVGIEMASAMKAKDRGIRVQVQRELVAMRLNVQVEPLTIFPFDGQAFDFEDNWEITELLFDGLPVIHWISEKATRIATEHDHAKMIEYSCTFRPDPRWTYQGRPIMVGSLVVKFTCGKDWVSQPVNPDVSLGYYDHLRKRVVVPGKQWYVEGLIDNEAWKETNKGWDDSEMEPNSFRFRFTVVKCNLPIAPGLSPKLDEIIAEEFMPTVLNE